MTQQWVRSTGTRFRAPDVAWLQGPSARTTGIEEDDFDRHAAAVGYERAADSSGLLADFGALRSKRFDPTAVDPRVVDFYQRTARYRLHLWSQWSPAFRPLARAIDTVFAQRLGQLQLPLAPLDTSRGVTSSLVRFAGGEGEPATAWVRRRLPGRDVIYAGLYTIARPPLAAGPCVKVTFPLPNGSASVFLEPSARSDGALELSSAGRTFGEAGFYFVVVDGSGSTWVKHVPQLTERIVVYADDAGELHTDHVLRMWRRVFLRLHYAMPVAG
jgi:hypothetical protein